MQVIGIPTCNISKASGMGKVLQKCKLIVWHGCKLTVWVNIMTHKEMFGVLDRLLQNLPGNIKPFDTEQSINWNILTSIAGNWERKGAG
ncbi:unnamed protein product [Onchocerca ochengi]|uniref:Ovule protein n=1 Tax=Onchocerca ochengi TaxID=42157 RepID=A0A182ECG8_ONCOC|nr:unnamed protein product [Onchocerca ochengi]